MGKKSKLYRAQMEKVDRSVLMTLLDAMKLLKELPQPKFDQTVELSFRLGPKVPGRRRGTRGFPAAPRQRPRESFFNASRGPSPLP